MATDPNRPNPGTPPPPPPRRGADQPSGPADVEAFDPLKLHDPSQPRSQPSARTRRLPDDVAWLRASDALVQTTERVAGRGMTWTAQTNPVSRLSPARSGGTGRRAIDRASTTPRTAQLAPLDAFGTSRRPPAGRTAVSR
ncbi:MAG: hypothetical protein KG028_01695 [Actinobacteria bacterium]|jgi:hypothetical protein|nr:hypothetical protein [Actinomycetota bacterium]